MAAVLIAPTPDGIPDLRYVFDEATQRWVGGPAGEDTKYRNRNRKVVNCAKCGRRLLAADRKAKKCLHCGAFYNVA